MNEQTKPAFSRRIKIMVVALVSVVALSGCAAGQIKGLVMGGADSLMPAHLSTATVDVVLDKGYDIQQKPVCRATDEDMTQYLCNGVTVDGLKVIAEAHSAAHSEADMKISVGEKQIFEGTMAEIFTRQYEGVK